MPRQSNQPPVPPAVPAAAPAAPNAPAGGVGVNVAPPAAPTPPRTKRTKEEIEKEAAELAAAARELENKTLTAREESLGSQKLRNMQRMQISRQKLKDSLAKQEGMETYRDGLALLLEIVDNAVLFAEFIGLMAASMAPGCYPQTFDELLSALASPFKKLGDFIVTKVSNEPLTKNLQMRVTRNAEGVIQPFLSMRGQDLDSMPGKRGDLGKAIQELYNALVMDYVMSEGYDVDISSTGERKVVYAANHPEAGEVISEDAFNELFKDNCQALRECFVERAIEKSPQLKI